MDRRELPPETDPTTDLRVVHYQSMFEWSLLSVEECAATVAFGRAQPQEAARVQSGYSRYRKGSVAWLTRDSAMTWVFERIEALAEYYAQKNGIDVTRLCDSMQFVTYEVGGHFDWHMDVGSGEAHQRKITVCVQLTDANTYEGGELEFVGEQPHLARRAIGSATAFQSLLGHRLARVSKGTRQALVAWMLGPPFR